MKKQSAYVDITKKEFEAFLRGEIRKPFSLKQGTKGVYIIHISDNVGLAINSTVGAVQSKRKGQASIRLNFVSLHKDKYHKTIYGYDKIMKRVVRKKWLQRSTNWRVTLKDAVDKCLKFYSASESFLERIAEPEDEQATIRPSAPVSSAKIQESIEKIESIRGWENEGFLVSLHQRLSGGRELTERQEAALDRWLKPPKYTIDLQSLRGLYRTLSGLGATSNELESLAEIGQKVKNGPIGLSDYNTLISITKGYNVRMSSYTKVSSKGTRLAHWNKVQVGNKVSEIYYRGIPTGSIQKVASGFEAFINNFGRQKSLGVFNSEDKAFNQIKKIKGS